MIGKLTGKIVHKDADGILLDVGGVGYEIAVPLAALANLPRVGEIATLPIHTHVREDVLKLFGFASDQDKLAFRTMLKVSGVGPKLAVAVLGTLSGDQLAHIVDESDAKRLSSVPGIGKKTAERLILELGGKLVLTDKAAAQMPGSIFSDLSSALVNLGFKPAQVDRVIDEVKAKSEKSGDQSFEVLLRAALALLQKK